MRKNINLHMNIQTVIMEMSEGNPGAVSVLTQILTNHPMGFASILSLDDMNIRGSQIWVGYKDHCKENLQIFIDCITKRDKEMVDTINDYNKLSGNKEICVTSGASFERSKQKESSILDYI